MALSEQSEASESEMTMSEMFPHHCSACGELHGGDRESDEVRIAKIQADRDIAVARMSRADSREYNESHEAIARTEAAAAVEVAEIEAIADVAESSVKADVLEEIVAPEPEPESAPVIVGDVPDDGDEPPAPPEVESSSKSSGGFWSGYATS